MAGRYVIIEFDDRDAAGSFVANEYMPEQLSYKLIAMFIRPKVFCRCPDKQRQHVNNWRKHPKFGVYICQECRKPSRFHEGGLIKRLQYTFGYNILPVEHEDK